MDDLLQPSLQDQTKVKFDPPPFSSHAQYIVTFFGGVSAAWYFSYLNTQRLKADDQTLKQINMVWLGSTILALIAFFIVATQIDIYPFEDDTNTQRYIRYANRILAVIINIYIGRLQKPWFSRHAMFTQSDQETAYGSPWVAGLISVFIVSIPFGFLTLLAVIFGDNFNGA